VLREGIAEADEIPPECGVLIASEQASEQALDVATAGAEARDAAAVPDLDGIGACHPARRLRATTTRSDCWATRHSTPTSITARPQPALTMTHAPPDATADFPTRCAAPAMRCGPRWC